jgi:UDP-glucose 4-epimerase
VRSFHEYDGFNIVLYVGAFANVKESIQNPIEYFNVNSMGTVRVGCECARREVRLVNISYKTSGAGEIKHGVADVSKLRERIEFNPISLKEGGLESLLNSFG